VPDAGELLKDYKTPALPRTRTSFTAGELPGGRRCWILSLNTKCCMSENREPRDFVIFYLTGELRCGGKQKFVQGMPIKLSWTENEGRLFVVRDP